MVRQQEIDNKIDDIPHIKPIKAGTQHLDVTYTFGSVSYWLAYLIVVVILVAVILIYRRHIRLEADVAGRKLAKHRAWRTSASKRRVLSWNATRTTNSMLLCRVLCGAYLSDKLSIPASQLTRDNISSKLEAYGVDEDRIRDVVDVLDQCEMARFTPTHSDDEVADLYTKAAQSHKQH